MLVKGSARGGPVALARHLEAEENERVRIIGIHGVSARNIEGALIEMDALGACLKTHRTLYHMSINPEPGKDHEMREGDWKFAEHAALKKMGLDGQPYIAIEHEKIGHDGVLRRHRHLVASRTDLEHMRAIRADHNYRKHEEVARAIERHLGHEKVQGAHAERDGIERPERTPSYAEMQQAKRGAVSRDEAKTLITQLWHTTDTAGALKAALEDQGWMLARGDKTTAKGRVYLIVIDPQGGLHDLARRVADVKAAAVHERMAAVDAAGLPSVDEARALQKAARQVEPQREDNCNEKAQPMSDPPDASKQPANQNERPAEPPPPASDNVKLPSADEAREALQVWAAWRQPTWSLETIATDPWTAVYLPNPDIYTTELRILGKAFNAATACLVATHGPRVPQGEELADSHDRAMQRADELSQIIALEMARRIQAAEAQQALSDIAANQNNPEHIAVTAMQEPLETSGAADKAQEALQVWAAWQQPAFNFETIRADPWTAVYLPVPDDASSLLLTRAFSAASLCIDAIDSGAFGPRVVQGNDGATENRAKAEARMAELEPMLTLAANQNRPEHIAVAAAQEPHQAPDVLSASIPPPPEPTPSQAAPRPEIWQIEDVRGGTVLSADMSTPEGVQSAEAFLDAFAQQKLAAEAERIANMTVLERVSDQVATVAWGTAGIVEEVAARALKGTRRALEAIGDRFETFVHFLSDFIAPPPPPTRDQVEIAAKVADERAQEKADIDAWMVREAEYDWREMQIARSEQAEDLALGDLYGTPATREGTHLARQHVRCREDDYERDDGD